MFYLLAMVTFLSSILIYSLYPRSDGVTSIDIPTAESAAMELVAQHSAALQAATVLTADANGNKSMKYEKWENEQIDSDKYTSFLPSSFVPNPTPGNRPYSQILCVDNAKPTDTTTCGSRTADTAANVYGTTDFVITYISKAAIANNYGEYIANLTPRALGKLTHFTPYETELHLTTNCGLVESGKLAGKDFDPYNATHHLTDTRYDTVNLPAAFTEVLDSDHEYIACITRISRAYDNKTSTFVVPKVQTSTN